MTNEIAESLEAVERERERERENTLRSSRCAIACLKQVVIELICEIEKTYMNKSNHFMKNKVIGFFALSRETSEVLI